MDKWFVPYRVEWREWHVDEAETVEQVEVESDVFEGCV